MKILRVIPSVNPADGGTVESLVNSSARLLQYGHVVEVASLDFPESPWARQFVFPLHALGFSKSVFGYSPVFRQWLEAHVSGYDVVIIEGIWQYHALAAATVCRQQHAPYFVYPHGMLDPWFKRTYPLKHVKKLVYWLLFLRRILREASGVIFTADEERQLARQSFPFYQCKEVVASLGIVDQTTRLQEQRQVFLDAYPHLEGVPFFLFLGRIHPKKGVDILVESFARACAQKPGYRLVVVGPDETGWKQGLEELARRLGVDNRVEFTGPLHGDLKWGALACADCFVLPSHQENFGISVVEALSASLPVLITNKVNIYREVTGNKAGIACDDNVTAFTALIEAWLSMGEEARDGMRYQARACFLRHFEIDRAAKSLEGVLIDAKP